MKRHVFFIGVLLVMVTFFSNCQSDDGPEKVAGKYLTHLSNNELEEAAKYCTEETAQMLLMVASMSEVEETSGEKHENLECSIDDDRAKCTYNLEGSDEQGFVDLIKVDEEWKVYMEK